MMTEQLAVFELQRLLLNDADGANRRAIERELQSWRQRLKLGIERGLTTREFEALRTILDAVDAATEVIDTTWRRHRHEIVA